MRNIAQLKFNPKWLIIPAMAAVLLVAIFLGTQKGGSADLFGDAVQGGELTLTSVDRNYQSLEQFVGDDEAQAKQLLEAAREALENAEVKLNSAARIKDDYVLGMVGNYKKVTQASGVMARGVNNLLSISPNLTNTFHYYSQRDYEKAYEEASYCLQVLEPLLSDFEASNKTLESVNVFYIPPGQRDQLKIAFEQYQNETEIYNQYVQLLKSLLQGKDYLQMDESLEESMRQFQKAVSEGDYGSAQELMNRISEILQSLRGSKYQDAADLASKLMPDLLKGTSSAVAQEIRNRLMNLEGIDAFDRYLQGLENYLEALRNFEKDDFAAAEQNINTGLGVLQQGGSGDNLQIQSLYRGLTEAFDTLRLRMRGQYPPG